MALRDKIFHKIIQLFNHPFLVPRIGFVSYFVIVLYLGFVFMNHTGHRYIDENALSFSATAPDSQTNQFLFSHLSNEIQQFKNKPSMSKYVLKKFRSANPFHSATIPISKQCSLFVSTLFPKRTEMTDAIVFSTSIKDHPQYLAQISFISALHSLLGSQGYQWQSSQIIFLLTEAHCETESIQYFFDSYMKDNNVSLPTQILGGWIHQAFHFDFQESEWIGNSNFATQIALLSEGANGKQPNMDLVALLSKAFESQSATVVTTDGSHNFGADINSYLNYQIIPPGVSNSIAMKRFGYLTSLARPSLLTLYSSITSLSKAGGSGVHSFPISHKIDAITIKSLHPKTNRNKYTYVNPQEMTDLLGTRGGPTFLHTFLISIFHAIRSFNGISEHLHHSLTQYWLSSASFYVKVALSVPFVSLLSTTATSMMIHWRYYLGKTIPLDTESFFDSILIWSSSLAVWIFGYLFPNILTYFISVSLVIFLLKTFKMSKTQHSYWIINTHSTVALVPFILFNPQLALLVHIWLLPLFHLVHPQHKMVPKWITLLIFNPIVQFIVFSLFILPGFSPQIDLISSMSFPSWPNYPLFTVFVQTIFRMVHDPMIVVGHLQQLVSLMNHHGPTIFAIFFCYLPMFFQAL